MLSISRKVTTIRDVVHGLIQFSPVITALIDTPEFQRLRDVRQLGLSVSYVFPSATHSRFEHCIGTAHITGRVLRHLSIKHPGHPYLTPKYIEVAQIAALFHDVGHGPWSHLFDEVLKMVTDSPITHEERSQSMLREVYSRNVEFKQQCDAYGITRDDIEFACLMIHKSPSAKFPSQAHFLLNLVSNSVTGLDTDKLDYLLRDAHHTGLRKLYDLDRLIYNTKLVNVDGSAVLAFHVKTAPEVIHVFIGRMHMHSEVYQHKTVKKVETMILHMIQKIVKDDETFKQKLVRADTSSSEMVMLSDADLLCKIRSHHASRAIYLKLIHRNLCHLTLTDKSNDSNMQVSISFSTGCDDFESTMSKVKFYNAQGKIVALPNETKKLYIPKQTAKKQLFNVTFE